MHAESSKHCTPTTKAMTKPPTNGNNSTEWKEVIYVKHTKGKKKTMEKTAEKKGLKAGKYDGINGILVKQEEIKKALVDKSPSPKRKRDNSTEEIIILDDDSDNKTSNKYESESHKEIYSIESSEEDEILQKLPAPRKKKGRRFVDFMDFSDDEDEDMKLDDDDQDADEMIHESTKIVETENPEDTNDNVDRMDTDSDDDEFWTKDEVKLAVALWNDADPTQITYLKGRWYHMYSGRNAPLRDPSDEFIADAVKANKGRKTNELINPWPKKQRSKEPKLIEVQKAKEKTIATTTAKAEKISNEQGYPKTTAPYATGTSVLKPVHERKYDTSHKKTVAPTMFAANQQWLNRAEKVITMASTQQKENKNESTPSPSKITAHFKSSKVTPPLVSTGSKARSNKKQASTNKTLENPYKPSGNGGQKPLSVQEAIVMEPTGEESEDQTKPTNGSRKTDSKITDTFQSKQSASFADAISGKTFERVMKKHTRRFAVSFNVQIKIDGPNDGDSQEKALRKAFEQFLLEGQRIDNSFGILPWKTEKPLPTVYDAKEVKKLPYDSLIQYLRGPMQGRYIKQISTGRNFRWRLHATFNMDKPEIFHERWGRVVLNSFTVRDFPTQTEQCWPIGFCMGSTERQDITEINKHLGAATGFDDIRVSYENIYHQGVTQKLWKNAVNKSKDLNPPYKNRVKHQWAPAGLMVFVTKKEDVGPARKKLYEMYGRNVTDVHGNTDAYPIWPGGAQMKFVPQAERNMSAANKQKIGDRLTMHTTMKGQSGTIKTDLKDPNLRPDCLEGKSIGEVILEIMMPDNKDPVFRHVQKDWHPDIDRNNYSLVYHSAFETEAQQCANTLKNVLVEQYGDGILVAFKEGMRGLNNHYQTYGNDTDAFDIDLDDDEDKYHRITVTNLDMVTNNTTTNVDAKELEVEKGDDSLLTGMENTVALSNTSDKTTRTAQPTVTTDATKSASLISELTDDLHTGMQNLLLRQEMKDALKIGKLDQEVLKNLVMAILNTGTSADDDPGQGP